MRKTILSAVLLAAVVALPTVHADIFLNDLNTTIRFSQDQSGNITGMDDWIVDGTDHLFTQWFWFRVGDVDPEQGLQVLDQTINAVTNRYLDVTFEDPDGRFAIDVTYSLLGGTAGSGLSDVAEQIRVRNTGRLPLDFRFFQYSDFDLNNNPFNDTVFLDGYQVAQVFDSSGAVFTETVLTPAADYREANNYPNTLNKLNDASPDNLNNVAGPLSGDVTWAFQWNRALAPGGSFLISKDKSIQIPAPGAALLGVMGLGLVGYIKRRFS